MVRVDRKDAFRSFSTLSMAGEWELCGDRFYERVELYRPTWGGLEVEDMR